MSAAISFEGGAGRGTLWLKSETATVHNRLSMVLATRAVLSIAYVFCNAPNSRHASVSWVVISTLQLYMQIGLQGRKNT